MAYRLSLCHSRAYCWYLILSALKPTCEYLCTMCPIHMHTVYITLVNVRPQTFMVRFNKWLLKHGVSLQLKWSHSETGSQLCIHGRFNTMHPCLMSKSTLCIWMRHKGRMKCAYLWQLLSLMQIWSLKAKPPQYRPNTQLLEHWCINQWMMNLTSWGLGSTYFTLHFQHSRSKGIH